MPAAADSLIIRFGHDRDALDIGRAKNREIATRVGALDGQQPVQVIDASKDVFVQS